MSCWTWSHNNNNNQLTKLETEVELEKWDGTENKHGLTCKWDPASPSSCSRPTSTPSSVETTTERLRPIRIKYIYFCRVYIITTSSSLIHLFTFLYSSVWWILYSILMSQSKCQHTGIIHMDSYLHSALLTQLFTIQSFLSEVFHSLRRPQRAKRLQTVTLGISAFQTRSQKRQENRWRQDILLLTGL